MTASQDWADLCHLVCQQLYAHRVENTGLQCTNMYMPSVDLLENLAPIDGAPCTDAQTVAE